MDLSPELLSIISAQLPQFQIGTKLGGGAQGSVFQAILRDTAQPIALKLLGPEQDVSRLRREIEALENYHHPNMADLLSHGTFLLNGAKCHYVAWELIDGEALATKLGRGALTQAEAAALGRDISRSIFHIWQKRIVHRDIKPPNIMIRASTGEAVLIDLGVARHMNAPTITAAGFFCGTPGFMSPEQARAEKNLTCLSDVFSLGVVLLTALIGSHPTRGDQNVLMTKLLDVSSLAPAIRSDFSAILQGMLQLRPAFRPHPLDLATQFALIAGTT